jgi:RNA polymerase sigma-70 factor (ECF subfamily)
MTEASDQELIRRVADGHEDAYGELVERYQYRLQASLAAVCGNSDEVRQLAHDAFVQAFFRLKTYKSDYPFYPWLRKVAVNLKRNRQRKQERRRLIVDQHLEDIRSLYPTVADDTKDDNYIPALRECLEALPSEQKAVLEERYKEQRPVMEIATVLGRNPGAVKMQLHRLRAILKQCIHGKLMLEGEL